jgi:hypothetical protein
VRGDGGGHVRIVVRQQPVLHIHQGDRTARGSQRGGRRQPPRAAAGDQYSLRRGLRQPVRRDHRPVVGRHAGRQGGAAARGDDHVAGRQTRGRFGAGFAVPHHARPVEAGDVRQHGHAVGRWSAGGTRVEDRHAQAASGDPGKQRRAGASAADDGEVEIVGHVFSSSDAPGVDRPLT